MAFDFRNWGVMQPGGTQEFLQDGSVIGAPGIYTYQSQDETLLDISSVDYFSSVGNTLFINDLLYITASDGIGLFYVLAVDFETGNLIIAREDTPDGDVHGPGTSTLNAFSRWGNTVGTLLKNSGIVADDGNNVSGIVDMVTTGLLQVGGPVTAIDSVTVQGIFSANSVSELNTVNLNFGSHLAFKETTNTFKADLVASNAMGGDYTLTLPTALPASDGEQLSCTTGGVLSWEAAAKFAYEEATGAIVSVEVNKGYFLNSGLLTTFNLPAVASMGDRVEIRTLVSSGSSFRVVPNGAQVITLAGGQTGIGGYIESTGAGDTIELTFGPDGLDLWLCGPPVGLLNVV